MAALNKVIGEDIKPQIYIQETQAAGIGEKDVGGKARAILSFEIVEKTKSYTMMRINHIYLIPTARR